MKTISPSRIALAPPVATATAGANKPHRLDSLQLFRGVAALLVVLHHAGTFSQGHLGAPFLGNTMEWGASGVDFFFVLSGFIIFFIHRGDLGQPGRLRAFALKRVVRVYPIYWVACAVVIPLFFLFPASGPDYARDPVAIVTSVLLVPQVHFPVLAQAWTLTYEMLFYAIFALLIARYRVFVFPVFVWMTVCVAIYLLELGRGFAGAGDGHPLLAFPWNWLFSRHNLLFGAGVMAAALAGRAGGVRHPRALLWTGILLYLAFAALNQAGSPFDPVRTFDYPLTFGLASTLIVVGSAGLDLAGRGIRVPGLLLYVGNASYSIYLFHSIAMSLAVRPAAKLVMSHRLGVNAAGLGMCLFAVAVGCLAHSLVERPLLGYLRRRLALRGT